MFRTVTEYNHALAKDHQSRAEMLSQNTREAFEEGEFVEATHWQRMSASHAFFARVYLSIKERDYDYS